MSSQSLPTTRALCWRSQTTSHAIGLKYNRTTAKVDEFLANEAKGTRIIGAQSIAEMVGLLKKPRRVMMLVKAGQAVDDFIAQVAPHLEPGDIIATGTPAGVGIVRQPPRWLVAGDTVRVEIDGIGALENPIIDEPADTAVIA